MGRKLLKPHILLKLRITNISKVYSFTRFMLEIAILAKLPPEKNAVNKNKFLTISKMSKVIVAIEK